MFLDMVPIALMFSAPIIIAALGGLFSERSGVVNVALEGIMMVGGFFAATVTVFMEGVNPALAPWMGMAVGLLAGILFSILHAIASVNLKADQVVSGTALNILAGGLTVYLAQIIFNQQRTRAFSRGLSTINVPGLQNIPLLGKILFQNIYPTFYVALILILLTWFLVYKTRLGLRLRSCGENPQAAASMGIDVYKIRYFGVLMSGAFAGLAGGVMVLTQDIQYTITSIHGTGFIALGSLIFGKWNPWGVLGAGLFFGFSQAISLYAKDIPFLASFPQEFFYLLPYVLTILALILFSNRSVGPKAAGEIYDPGKR
jgi:simple sugar transport system permease protein